MRYGHFDDEKREYVITRPDTPLPWINYLGCEDYLAIISNTGGGYSFYRDARLRRLIRFRHNNAPLDVGGRYVYLRDDGSRRRGPLFWSPSWMPTRQPLDSYECRHGIGYTIIKSECAGIEAQTRYFVPLGQNLEVWELSLTNHRPDVADLSLFAAVEFCLWDALDDATNFQRNYSIGEVEPPEFDESDKGGARRPGIILHKSEYRERRNHFAYFACSEPLSGFDTDREAFLGPCRGWDAPLAVERGQASNSIASGWQPIGAHHVKVQLLPGQRKQVIFLLGYHENPPEAKFDPPSSQNVNRRTLLPVLDRFLKAEAVEEAFRSLNQYWERLLAKFSVHTPNLHTNRMVNIWNAYQVMVTFKLSRSASYFESGIGRGMGFRDSNQDLLGFVHMVPERARERLLDLAATQLPTGGAYHQYQPLTRRGNNDIGTDFNDDPLWLVLSVVAYVKETGDWDILAEPVAFDNQPGTEKPLFEHLQRSIQYTLDRLGPHGLPLIGRADWNDCLNLNCFSDSPGQSFQTTANKEGRVAESVFIAGLFILACKEMLELTQAMQQTRVSSLLPQALSLDIDKAIREMEAAVWRHGWDGEWFRRAYDDYGRPLGSRENDEGRIFIEPQGMCVMAGLGLEDGRAQKALDAVASHLATGDGILLHQPSFTRYYLHLGEISSYPPGYKENGSVFCHTNPWIMIAEAVTGRGDAAHDYYLRINPSVREQVSDVHRCEPYVYAQTIAGRDAPRQGEAKNSWLTGSAAWNYVAITQWILGIRPTYAGLKIDPVIPSAWAGFEATRAYRGAILRIVVHNPDGVCRGVVRLSLDGRELNGNVLPADLSGGLHDVEVWLGNHDR
jgi:cellobiose phosphorylase